MSIYINGYEADPALMTGDDVIPFVELAGQRDTWTTVTKFSALLDTLPMSGGTANGVLYLDGSKVVTSGSALTFDGTNFTTTGYAAGNGIRSLSGNPVRFYNSVNSNFSQIIAPVGTGDMQFDTGAGEQMRLNSTGLGIGTSNPTDKLTVSGGAAFSRIGLNANAIDAVSTSQSFARFQSTGGDFYIGTESSVGGAFFPGSTAYAAVLFNASTTPMQFYTNGTLRATLDQSGNLGLGVTPSTWSLGKAFQVNSLDGAVVWGYAGAAQFGNNFYYNGGYLYATTAAATRYAQSSGAHQWFTSTDPTPTAGNPISFTQAMTLDASGNLAVGTTDTTAVKLKVQSGSDPIVFLSGFNGAGTMGVIGANPLDIYTNGQERIRITSGGDFGIGNTNPLYRLTVDKDTTSALAFFTNSNASAPNGAYIDFSAASPNNATQYFLYCEDSTAQRATIRSNGGLANYQSNNVDLSDARTKKDITPAPSYWSKIGALEIVTYKYKDQTHDDINVGVIAQQVEQVEPVWVDADGFGETPEGEEPLKTVYTKDITFAAIKALQEAMIRIEQLEARLAAAGI